MGNFIEHCSRYVCLRAVNVTVRRSKQPRDYLIEKEIEKLIDAAG
jgi:hypothetical protein